MALDIAFLDVTLSPARTRPKPVNVYDILREGWRETRVDMTLRFFLDPTERHGLGSLVVDALLRTAKGARSVTMNGATGPVLPLDELIGSDAWGIETQVDFIDVYATNRDLDVAIVLENKIGHVLNNPLRSYAARAQRDGFSTVVVLVLAPEWRQHLEPEQQKYVSATITYSDLADEIKRSPELLQFLLAPADLDQRRSLELLQQFIEARSGETVMSDLEDEAKRLDEWRAILETHGLAIKAFEEARSSIGRLIRDRRRRLEPLLTELLSAAGLAVDGESHGGLREETWSVYYFPEADWTVELKFSADPGRPPIFVYDRRGKTYKDSTIEPLGLEWSATDEAIAEAFVVRVVEILKAVRAAT